MLKVYLRFLKPEDAEVSWKWRNDPEVWKFTFRKWNNLVTKEIEEAWINRVNKEKNSIRFAICVGDSGEYVGNVQLTDITDIDGIFHIFIGDKKYWGKGIGQIATKKLIEYVGENLNIKRIKLRVKKENVKAVKIYKNCGFKIIPTLGGDEFHMMVLSLESFRK